ncbi:hypothetical protein [Nostoc sp.]|uniref:hypothetical protein n=1 Tax=Nostoc sp. TaxID=1180 RepID=UPI002FF56F3C
MSIHFSNLVPVKLVFILGTIKGAMCKYSDVYDGLRLRESGDSQRILGTITSTAVYQYLGTSEACDRNPMQTFCDVSNRLNSFGLAYLHIIDGKVVVTSYLPVGVARRRHRFRGGSLIAPPLMRIPTITLVNGNHYV